MFVYYTLDNTKDPYSQSYSTIINENCKWISWFMIQLNMIMSFQWYFIEICISAYYNILSHFEFNAFFVFNHSQWGSTNVHKKLIFHLDFRFQLMYAILFLDLVFLIFVRIEIFKTNKIFMNYLFNSDTIKIIVFINKNKRKRNLIC